MRVHTHKPHVSPLVMHMKPAVSLSYCFKLIEAHRNALLIFQLLDNKDMSSKHAKELNMQTCCHGDAELEFVVIMHDNAECLASAPRSVEAAFLTQD